MDITLTRILSLLPQKDDGTFVRGAKKNFAISIGYDSGDIVSMWIKGTSQSYMGKLHEIASKYNVSVEWLKGETSDPGIKKAPPTGGALEAVSDLPSDVQNLIEICKGNPELTTALLNLAQQIEKSRSRPE